MPTPLTPSDVAGIMRDIVENRRRLAACSGPHEFQLDAEASRPFKPKERCATCRGTVSGRAAEWYRLGLEHGRRQQQASTTAAVP